MPTEIRKMLPEELEQVTKIACSSKWTKDLPYCTKRWSGEGNIRVMVVDGEIVAYAYYVVTKYRNYVNMYWIGTRPGCDGKGYGKAMLEHLMAEGSAAGKEMLKFKVNKKNEALGFYTKLGMTPSGETEKEMLFTVPLKTIQACI